MTTEPAEEGSEARPTQIASDGFAQMKELAEELSRRLGGLDVEVDHSYADRKWHRMVPTGKVLIDGADLLKFLERLSRLSGKEEGRPSVKEARPNIR